MAIRGSKGSYRIEFTFKGHRVFKRLPRHCSKQEAVEYEEKLRKEIFNQVVLGHKPTVSIGHAISEWLKETTAHKAHHHTSNLAKRVSEVVGDYALGRFVEAAGVIREEASERGLANSSINRRLCILKAAAKFAFLQNWTEENFSHKIRTLPENPGRQLYLREDQIDQLIKATPERSKAFVAIAVYTGLRQSQVMQLTPKNIVGGAIRLGDSKGGIPLAIPIVDTLQPFLEALPFKLHKRTHYADFEDARVAIGMPTLRYHDLRHTTASLMIQRGVDIFTVGEVLGHRSIQTTKRYAHLTLDNKRAALESAFSPSKSHQSGAGKEVRKRA